MPQPVSWARCALAGSVDMFQASSALASPSGVRSMTAAPAPSPMRVALSGSVKSRQRVPCSALTTNTRSCRPVTTWAAACCRPTRKLRQVACTENEGMPEVPSACCTKMEVSGMSCTGVRLALITRSGSPCSPSAALDAFAAICSTGSSLMRRSPTPLRLRIQRAERPTSGESSSAVCTLGGRIDTGADDSDGQWVSQPRATPRRRRRAPAR